MKTLMRHLTKPAGFLSLSFLAVLADQISKWWVSEVLIRPMTGEQALGPLGLGPWLGTPPERLPYTELEITPFFNIVMVWNQGISFGMFNGTSNQASTILVALSLLIAAAFVIWLMRSTNKWQSLGIALVIGGAIGNVIDRVRFSAVIDFLDIHAFGYHWPAFNLADSFISVGVFILIVYSLFFEKKYG